MYVAKHGKIYLRYMYGRYHLPEETHEAAVINHAGHARQLFALTLKVEHDVSARKGGRRALLHC
jgi:hypothetical protein